MQGLLNKKIFPILTKNYISCLHVFFQIDGIDQIDNSLPIHVRRIAIR